MKFDRPCHPARRLLAALLLLNVIIAARANLVPTPPDDGKLRIICFGAHPDDSEIQAGGTGALWAAQGHHVLFVSVTNGDIGHWAEAGGPLALRRKKEVEAAHKHLGIEGYIMDVHDGELLPTLENRRTITQLIREWKADVVMSHRPNDYHPDHRYSGVLIQDAAYMVTVPFFCPDVPILRKNPAFFYYSDSFKKPNPFQPDIVVDIDSVVIKKVDALAMMVSQFQEGGANGHAGLFPDDQAGRQRRREEVRRDLANRYAGYADSYRDALVKFYGEEQGRKVRHAQAFEICEYGRQPSPDDLKKIFPF